MFAEVFSVARLDRRQDFLEAATCRREEGTSSVELVCVEKKFSALSACTWITNTHTEALFQSIECRCMTRTRSIHWRNRSNFTGIKQHYQAPKSWEIRLRLSNFHCQQTFAHSRFKLRLHVWNSSLNLSSTISFQYSFQYFLATTLQVETSSFDYRGRISITKVSKPVLWLALFM